MADTKNTKDIKVYVLATTKHADLLPEFIERFKKYWGGSFTVHYSDTSLAYWSDGVIDFLESLSDEYIILLHDDFYLTEPVDKELIEECKEIALSTFADRVSLRGNHTPIRTELVTLANGKQCYRHKPLSDYQLSFEGSIFRRQWLLVNMKRAKDPWSSETDYRFKLDSLVYSTEKAAIEYQDKLRRGQIQEI